MIKRILYIILPLMFLSCEKIFINGDLDGLWKLQKIETEEETIMPQNICYSFQRHLAMLGEYYDEGLPMYYMAEFTFEGGVMTMDNFYKFPGKDGECIKEELQKLFIFNDKVVFTVERLTEDKLVMSTDFGVYYFEKW